MVASVQGQELFLSQITVGEPTTIYMPLHPVLKALRQNRQYCFLPSIWCLENYQKEHISVHSTSYVSNSLGLLKGVSIFGSDRSILCYGSIGVIPMGAGRQEPH